MPAVLPRLSLRLGALAAAVLVVGCGGSDEATPTTTATTATAAPSKATPASATPVDGATPPSTSSAFPGLPLDQVTDMRFNAEASTMTFVTKLPPGQVDEGQSLCETFLEVSMFASDATVEILASDESHLATCERR